MLTQAVMGIFMIEFSWKRSARFRQLDEDRDKKYPLFRRNDNKKWARWKFYPGAMLWMPTRFVSVVLIALIFQTIASLLTCGHNFRNGPMKKGCRKSLVRVLYKFFVSLYIWVAGMWSSMGYKDCDYSYYLGPDYKKGYKQIRKTSTIVSNHSGWLDCHLLIKYLCPGFSPGIAFKGMPVMGKLCDISESLYVPKGGSPELLEKALNVI